MRFNCISAIFSRFREQILSMRRVTQIATPKTISPDSLTKSIFLRRFAIPQLGIQRASSSIVWERKGKANNRQEEIRVQKERRLKDFPFNDPPFTERLLPVRKIMLRETKNTIIIITHYYSRVVSFVTEWGWLGNETKSWPKMILFSGFLRPNWNWWFRKS